MRSEEIFQDFRTFSAHFPGFSHIFRTFSVVSAIFRTFPEKILSYPHTVLKNLYKNRFVSRKPPAAHVPRAERQERHPPPSRSERTFLRKRTRSLTTMVSNPQAHSLYRGLSTRVFRTRVRTDITGRIAAGQDGHCAERAQNQSFRTMYFIFPHSSDVFGGGGGNITPQV